jgi:hypothetical protein
MIKYKMFLVIGAGGFLITLEKITIVKRLMAIIFNQNSLARELLNIWTSSMNQYTPRMHENAYRSSHYLGFENLRQAQLLRANFRDKIKNGDREDIVSLPITVYC